MKLIQNLVRRLRPRPSDSGLEALQLEGLKRKQDCDSAKTQEDHCGERNATFTLESLWSAYTQDRSILIGKNEAREHLRKIYLQEGGADNFGDEALYPYVAELNNAVIFPGSRLIVNHRGIALGDEIFYSYREAAAQPKRSNFGMKIIDGPKIELNFPNDDIPSLGQGIHLTCEHEHNYFHWVTEILPRLLAFEMLNLDKSIPLLVSSGLHENMYSFLDIIKGQGRPVVKLEREKAYKVCRLTFPGDVSRILDDNVSGLSGELDYLPHGLLQELAATTKRNLGINSCVASKKIYLIRNRKYRIPSNQAEVISCLENLGFTAIDTAHLSFQEQVQLFSEAETIVAPSGAACTNMLWAPQGAKMLVLHADHPRLTFGYWNALAKASCVDISYLAGRRMHVRENVHDDFFIETDALRESVLR